MVLNPAWFNALVDDTGTGTTGTVWNKATIKGLTDSIDAVLPTSGGWSPTLATTGGTPIYSYQLGSWARNDKQITIAGRVSISSKGSLGAGGIVLASLPFSGAAVFQGGLVVGYFGGVTVAFTSMSMYMDPSVNYAHIEALPAGGSLGSVPLDLSQIAASFDLMFGGTYLIP